MIKKIWNLNFFFIGQVIFTLMGDEDQRVRNAVANCLVHLVQTWTTLESSSSIIRVHRLTYDCAPNGLFCSSTFGGIPLSITGLAKAYRDSPFDEINLASLSQFVDKLFTVLVTSDSRFTKVT